MRITSYALLAVALALTGCDRITGAANQRILDAEAIGYACRVSFKTPEECMKENEAQSPTSILDGWKMANKDIDGQLIDPTMGKPKAIMAQSQPVAAETEAQAAAAKQAEAPKSEKAAAPAAPKAAKH